MLLLLGNTVQAQNASFPDQVRRSGFIFVGTVEKLGAATPTIAPRANSAVVLVDSVIEAAKPIGNPTGQRVTVRLRNPQGVRNGDRFVFFTYVQAAGRTLELVEVGREAPTALATIERRIRAVRSADADSALSARLRSAAIVVTGTVGETARARAAGRPTSEHDPLWWRALIHVQSVVKGQAPGDSVSVYFASNVDYRWVEAPKLTPGEHGIFLLQPDREKRFRVSGFFLIDPLDRLPLSELGRVRRLIGRPR